jgi:hypothetical protein
MEGDMTSKGREAMVSMESVHSSPGEPRAKEACMGSDFGTRSQLGSAYASSGRARESRYSGIAMGDATSEGREARVSTESVHSSPGKPRAKGARREPATGFSRADSLEDAGAGASFDARIATRAAASEQRKAWSPAKHDSTGKPQGGRGGSARLRDVMGFMARTSASRPSLGDDQRAVGLADAMSRGARIFDSAVQATPAYARSRPVPKYAFFVSHSWSASRWDKFAGLLYR